MMKILLALFLLPLLAASQGVTPVISKDYLALIRQGADSQSPYLPDTTNSFQNATLRMRVGYNGAAVGKIKLVGQRVEVLPETSRALYVGGTVSTSVEGRSVNRLPATQTIYVQGRSQAGALVWQGPETGELFSFGPDVNTLFFDGSAYAYDVAGRLVSGRTGQPAKAYKNNLFRAAATSSQNINLQSRYLVNGRKVLGAALRYGQAFENNLLPLSNNTRRNIDASATGTFGPIDLTASFHRSTNRLAAGNRNGFLSRVYRNALLTPMSFENAQGTQLANGQRSYSALADNPLFLLGASDNAARQTSKGGGLVVEKKSGRFTFHLSQSLQSSVQTGAEGYAPGTAFFPAGVAVQRSQSDREYWLNAGAALRLSGESYPPRSRLSLNYVFNNSSTLTTYAPGLGYRFQRSAANLSLTSTNTRSFGEVEAGLNLSDQVYVSNTASRSRAFLPAISGYLRSQRLFDNYHWTAKLSGSYNCFVSEVPVSASFSRASLQQYSTGQAAQFFPTVEATGFDGLDPVEHREWSTRLEISYRNRYTFQAEVYRRSLRNDVFSVMRNGLLLLENLASHRTTGIEIEAGIHQYSRSWTMHNVLLFAASRSRVTAVNNGEDFTPLAGFSNVHKAIVKDQPLGVIVGSRYLRNQDGKMVIGSDGFPLVAPQPAVIGNPLPDFVLKWSHTTGWKRFTLNMDLEWRKGGDVWNGTAAALDYYGRSKASAEQRNTKSYVFDGVTADGHANMVAVDFYNPALPFSQNRWVRYGQSGVAEAYIERGDCLRLTTLALAYKIPLRKGPQNLTVSAYANNLLLWTAYKGADPTTALYDDASASGLDFFNLPSVKTLGCSLALQF